MKTIVIDTSALISLGHTELIDKISGNYEILISKGVQEELEDMSKREDDDSLAAKRWLSIDLKIKKLDRKESAEDELFEYCKDNGMILFTDDLKAIKRFENEVECFFSVHLVYLLFKKGIISKKRALIAVEKMKTDRDWKQNIISVTSKILFE